MELYAMIWDYYAIVWDDNAMLGYGVSVSNGRPYCFWSILFPYSFFFSIFCVHNFSKPTRLIYMKFSDLIDIDLNLIANFWQWRRHFRFWDIMNWTISKGSACPRVFS